MAPPILDSRQPDLATAKDILARLERYAAANRPPAPPVSPETAYPITSLDVLPAKSPRKTFSPATADLFPFDLLASILGCAATIVAYMYFGRPAALVITAFLAVGSELARRRRWFPSVCINLMIGLVAGVIFAFTA